MSSAAQLGGLFGKSRTIPQWFCGILGQRDIIRDRLVADGIASLDHGAMGTCQCAASFLLIVSEIDATHEARIWR